MKPTKVDLPKQVLFLNDIIKLCKKYNLSLGHEDDHGAFLVESYSDINTLWLLAARMKGEYNG